MTATPLGAGHVPQREPSRSRKGWARDPYHCPPSPRAVARSLPSLAQRLINPVGCAPDGSLVMVGVPLEDELGSGVSGEGLQIPDRLTALGAEIVSYNANRGTG